MVNLKDSIAKVAKGLGGSLREFPLEALLGLTYFIVFVLAKRIGAALDGKDIYYMFFWFFPHYVLLFSLHRLSGKHLAFKVLYFLSWFLWIPLLLWGQANSGWTLAVAYILAIILLIIGKEPLDNQQYGKNILDTGAKLVPGFLIGFLLMAIITAIVASIGFLFDLDLSDNWFTHPNAFIAFGVIPLLCCSFVTKETTRLNSEKAVRIAIDYILSPALVLYAVILLLYILRIIIRWELPDGGVAYMVAIFMALALLCYLLRLQLEKRHFEWFYKAFPAIAIPPLTLLWIGVIRRISDYGITEPRFYVLLIAILLTIFTAMLVKEKTRNFQLMTLIMAAALILFTYIPGIRAKDFERRSQEGRPEEAIEETSENIEKVESIHVWNLNDITEPIDLGEYTIFVPPSRYHYYEDSDVAIFYKDSTRTEELLRCEIRKALDAPGEDPLPRLVYKNDSYLALFDEISDINNDDLSFLTLRISLFRKP